MASPLRGRAPLLPLFLFALLIGAPLAGCTPTPTLRTEASPAANFGGYRSYAWVPLSQPPPAGERLTGLNDWRIRSDVDADLQARGWAQLSGADVMVDYGVVLVDKNTNTFSEYARYMQEGGNQGMAGAFVDGFQEGTLILHFYDGRTGKLVWRGAATAIVTPDSDNADILKKAIGEMLAKVPRQ